MLRYLLLISISLILFSCSSDDDDQDITCPSGGDTLAEVIPGATWNYNFIGSTGRVMFNEDGTYEDIENEVLDVDGNTQTKTWEINSEVLSMDITSDNGNSAGLTLDPNSVACERIVFDGGGFGDIVFTR